MKKWFLVMLVLAIAMIGMVSANISQPIGGFEGYYDITSSPSGAAVTIDGTSIGTTPATAIVMVTGTPGHTINVNKAGFEPWSQYFAGNPAEGQHIQVHAELVPIPTPVPTVAPGSGKGYYQVSSNPTGGSVRIRWDKLWNHPGNHYRKHYRNSRSHHHGLKIRLRDLEPVLFREPCCRIRQSTFMPHLYPIVQTGISR